MEHYTKPNFEKPSPSMVVIKGDVGLEMAKNGKEVDFPKSALIQMH